MQEVTTVKSGRIEGHETPLRIPFGPPLKSWAIQSDLPRYSNPWSNNVFKTPTIVFNQTVISLKGVC